ncbi:MAG: hypothetical protein KF757_00955 [Phycisphaeraceae bacterium]|nr:hypothetical protein [Phycisphaeraceae bacterium]MCW5761776.1 hypothetical protein [Phycisphaeraceae bacterium]
MPSLSHLSKRQLGIRVAKAASVVVIFILMIAGVTKLADLQSFAVSVGTWTLVPPLAHPIITVLVPVFELLLGLLLIANISFRVVSSIAIGLLVIYSAIYVAHVAFAEPPDCACFGKLYLFNRMNQDAVSALWRNAVLVLLLVPGLLIRHGIQGDTP